MRGTTGRLAAMAQPASLSRAVIFACDVAGATCTTASTSTMIASSSSAAGSRTSRRPPSSRCRSPSSGTVAWLKLSYTVVVGGVLLPALPEAQAADKVIEQAEWLVANYSPGRYRLVGNNCENIANWCTAGWYPESHQVRAGIGVVALVQAAALFIGSYRQRTSPKLSRWMMFAGPSCR